MAGFPITLKSKLKHGDLNAAAKKVGGQSALARLLAVSVSTVGSWCNLGSFPSFMRQAYKAWPPNRIAKLEKQLFELTGKTLEELFPPELRQNQSFLDANKTVETTKEIELLAIVDATTDRMMLPSPEDEASNSELRDRLGEVIKTLSYREREIIKLRFGLGGDGYAYTLEEVGHIFKVNKERIRQVEAKAIRKLQQPSRSQELVGFLD